MLVRFVSANMEHVPPRFGKAWTDDEVKKLLAAIAKKKPFDEIAKEHERTNGGIVGKLRQLAFEYHQEGRSMDDIRRFTGLDEETINDAIKRRTPKKPNKKKDALQEIHETLQELLDLQKKIAAHLGLLDMEE